MSKPNSVNSLLIDVMIVVLAAKAVILIAIMGHKILRTSNAERPTSNSQSEISPRHQTNCIWINESEESP